MRNAPVVDILPLLKQGEDVKSDFVIIAFAEGYAYGTYIGGQSISFNVYGNNLHLGSLSSSNSTFSESEYQSFISYVSPSHGYFKYSAPAGTSHIKLRQSASFNLVTVRSSILVLAAMR